MHLMSLRELADGLAAGRFSSVELTRHFLGRIRRFENQLNSLVTVSEKEALLQAGAADERIGQGKAGPLTGIPLIHKDIFCTKGVKTSCGSFMLDNFISPYDATVVEKLAAAGMVMLGKSNMDEFAM
ncbi:MAG TPA: Asp-tRNA(Asn)/Glu-tRNA(Gln) amidotransferase GatCAB subunit A, partial [Chromatiaceae bacterium]|nr:Asp-tRNA(Asn)/Glu-tRNA(Gln) amidotransferase GatCAB subunit A [Chromatiaceae bacterium]